MNTSRTIALAGQYELSLLRALAQQFPTVDAAMGMPHMRTYLHRLMRDEIAPTLGTIVGVDLAAYEEQLLVRFTNPALAHRRTAAASVL